MEMIVVVALIGNDRRHCGAGVHRNRPNRNSVWTASEQIGSQIRQARLKAITRNQNFRVAFDCPSVGQYRVLADPGRSGDSTTAPDRCNETLEFDSGVFSMPVNVSFGDVPLLQVNGRGIYSVLDVGEVLPLTITVQSRHAFALINRFIDGANQL